MSEDTEPVDSELELGMPSPSELELRALRDAELAEAAANAVPDSEPSELEAELSSIAEAIAELEKAAGPPSLDAIEELAGRLQAALEAEEPAYEELTLSLVGHLQELSARPEPVSEAELAELELVTQAEKARSNYFKRLRSIFGPDRALPECELCDGLGVNLSGSSASIEVQTVPYHEHDKYRRCQSCDGIGSVLTGSRLEYNATRDCPDCRGLGYLTLLEDGSPAEANGSLEESEARYGVEPWLGDPSLGPQA